MKNVLRVHSLVHVPEEGIGSIADWIEARGHRHTETEIHRDPTLPGAGDFDMLVVMGGPMSVNDEEAHPWLRAEKRLISDAIERGKIVVGICLGAQLIASALGASVRANRLREIGWFPVEIDTAVLPVLPASMTVFHWHGETFDLPAGSRPFASSAACANQGFLYGSATLGLQFHFEVTPDLIERMMKSGADEIVPGQYVQSVEEIRAGAARTAENNRIMGRLLDDLVERASR